jgi:hypothetical protein
VIDPASTQPAFIDPSIEARAVSFENPTGARAAGGSTHGGRKGAPSARIAPGETVVLADLEGPGIIRHIWMTFPPAPPESMRAVTIEVFYDEASEPSVSVPALDFFGLPHGRPVAYDSELTAVNEGRGFNSFVPMPFGRSVRVELTNHTARGLRLYYQIDVTLQRELPAGLGYLHAEFRRENPTEMRRDFVIVDGLRGPGRFLGCVVGVRVLDKGMWYGEGEVKMFIDGDTDLPTLCGTGLEDYVLSAWGLGAHHARYSGAPLVVATDPEQPDFVGFYRWHVPDPIMFALDLRVTIQQIGAVAFGAGDEETLEAYERDHPVAGEGWWRGRSMTWGIVERVDDYCSTAFVYCTEPQPVRRLDVEAALADIERLPYESAGSMELMAGVIEPDSTDAAAGVG